MNVAVTTFLLVIIIYINSGVAIKPAPPGHVICPRGGKGVPCGYGRPCRPGYNCINGICCKPRPVCESGITGPFCRNDRGCKPGYKCRGGRCCAVCPAGRRYGGRCNLNPGQQRCRSGYDCINNNLCCASKIVGPTRVCPRAFDKRACPRPHLRIRPVCRKNKDCGKGRLCCKDRCGRRYCTRGIIIPRKG